MGLLDVLIAGVGTGIGGVGQAVAGAREKRMDRELREADLAERRRQFQETQALNRELAFTEIDPAQVPETFRPLVVSLGQPTETGRLRVHRGLVPSIVTAGEKEQERRRLAGAAEGVAGRILTEGTQQPVRSMVDPDIAPAGQPFVDPRAQRSADLVRLAAVNPALAGVLERATQPEKLTSVAPGGRLIGERTGRVVAEGAPVEPKTTQETRTINGQQYRITYNQAGQELGRVPLGPADLNQGQRNEARAAEVLKARGITEGTPEWNEGMYILTNPTPTVPDVGVFSRLDVLGRKPPSTSTGPGAGGPAGQPGPTPRIPAPAKPVPGETTMQIVGVGRLRDAVKKIDAALTDPAAQPYFGPYAQYGALVQEKAPFGLAGKIPDSVIDLKQNLATVKNYTIRLITGAQMNKDEEVRIKEELPQLGYPEYMFRRYWSTTRENIAMLEKRIVGLALSGNQQAKAIAMELGLMPKDSGSRPPSDLPPQGEKELIQPTHTPTHRWNPATGRLEKIR